MQRLEITLPTAAENIALDEALLEWAEAENAEWEFLRLWESPQPVVVVGRSSRVGQEIDRDACHQRGIPVLRRTSGGAAIVAGPGCLMYAVVLSYHLRPELKDIGRAHAFVLGRLAKALQPSLVGQGHVHCDGTSDLVLEQGAGIPTVRSPLPAPRKFSGNSMRAKRTHLLYHGTLLYEFDLSLVEACLRMPPRQPGYRAGRSHGEFVANLPVDRQTLVAAIDCAWPTWGVLSEWPSQRVTSLVEKQFGQDSWNYEFR
jgi:lipoate---protein ligase